MKEEKIIRLLEKLNFHSIDGNIWLKSYDLNEIKVDINEKKIIYDKSIKIGRNTITNFSKAENFVVLECVIRLLDKGYKCENIELEKDCGDAKDYIDIVVYNINKKAFSIIECKTYGIEFKKAISKAQS